MASIWRKFIPPARNGKAKRTLPLKLPPSPGAVTVQGLPIVPQPSESDIYKAIQTLQASVNQQLADIKSSLTSMWFIVSSNQDRLQTIDWNLIDAGVALMAAMGNGFTYCACALTPGTNYQLQDDFRLPDIFYK